MLFWQRLRRILRVFRRPTCLYATPERKCRLNGMQALCAAVHYSSAVRHVTNHVVPEQYILLLIKAIILSVCAITFYIILVHCLFLLGLLPCSSRLFLAHCELWGILPLKSFTKGYWYWLPFTTPLFKVCKWSDRLVTRYVKSTKLASNRRCSTWPDILLKERNSNH